MANVENVEITPDKKLRNLLASFISKAPTENKNKRKRPCTSDIGDILHDEIGTEHVKEPKRRPIDSQDEEAFFQRVESYDLMSWFAMPLEVSPLVCSHFGWRNKEKDILQCVGCKSVLCGQLPRNTESLIYHESCRKLIDSLKSSHVRSCFWPAYPSPESYSIIPIKDRVKLKSMVSDNIESLQAVSTLLPNVSLDTFIKKGWQANQLEQMKSIAETNFEHLHLDNIDLGTFCLAVTGWKSINSKAGMVMCHYCRRKVGLWNYRKRNDSNIHERSEESEDEVQSPLPPILHNQELLMDTSAQENPSCENTEVLLESSVIDNHNIKSPSIDNFETNLSFTDHSEVLQSIASNEQIDNLPSIAEKSEVEYNPSINSGEDRAQSPEMKDDKVLPADEKSTLHEFIFSQPNTEDDCGNFGMENKLDIEGENMETSKFIFSSPKKVDLGETIGDSINQTVENIALKTELPNCEIETGKTDSDGVKQIEDSEVCNSACVNDENSKANTSTINENVISEKTANGFESGDTKEIKPEEDNIHSDSNGTEEKMEEESDKDLSETNDLINQSVKEVVENSHNQQDAKSPVSEDAKYAGSGLSENVGTEKQICDNRLDGTVDPDNSSEMNTLEHSESDNIRNKEISSHQDQGLVATDGSSSSSKTVGRKKIKVVKKESFDPLEEHRYWCPWIHEVSEKLSGSPQKITDLSQGEGAKSSFPWEHVLQAICPSFFQIQQENSMTEQFKQRSPVAGLRQLRKIIKEW